jgi:hypothetical protein
MSAGEEKKKSGNAVLVLAAVGVVALGGAVVWLQQRSEKAKANLERSVEEFNELRDLKAQVVDIQRKAGGAKKVQTPSDNPQDLVVFFGKKRTENSIPNIGIKEPDREVPWTGWREYPYLLTIRKEDAVQRSNFIRFLESIEKDRPYLKSKSITVNFEPDNSVWGTMTISFFKEGK